VPAIGLVGSAAIATRGSLAVLSFVRMFRTPLAKNKDRRPALRGFRVFQLPVPGVCRYG
jgi:hypothetical protein